MKVWFSSYSRLEQKELVAQVKRDGLNMMSLERKNPFRFWWTLLTRVGDGLQDPLSLTVKVLIRVLWKSEPDVRGKNRLTGKKSAEGGREGELLLTASKRTPTSTRNDTTPPPSVPLPSSPPRAVKPPVLRWSSHTAVHTHTSTHTHFYTQEVV